MFKNGKTCQSKIFTKSILLGIISNKLVPTTYLVRTNLHGTLFSCFKSIINNISDCAAKESVILCHRVFN